MIKSRRMSWAGHIACIGESRNAYRVLVRNPEGKRPLGRSRHGYSKGKVVPVLNKLSTTP
jgi:hypothetical protein